MERERVPHLAKPKPDRRGGGKAALLLLVLFMVIGLILFFRSGLSKIETIDVTGIRHTPLSDVGQAIGVDVGDSFFAASARTLRERVTALPNVEDARVEKSFPGRIVIEIREYPEVAHLVGPDGVPRALLANGRDVPLMEGETVRNLPVLTGWEPGSDLLRQMAGVLAGLPAHLLADISQIKPEPADAWPDRIRMYTRSYFEVVTTIGYLPDRLGYMSAIIDEYEPGVITMLEANTHTPYPPRGDAGEGPDAADGESGHGS